MGAREILERTYYGTADIYHFPLTEEDGVTEHVRTLLYEGIRCALSKTTINTAAKDGGASPVKYDAALFIAPEYDILPGCEIMVTQDGMERLFRYSGEAFRYQSHQELMLERMDYA